jgi:hypothetical protein
LHIRLIDLAKEGNVSVGVNREAAMVKRRDDKAPEPPGGRAAERLRIFEQARQPDPKKKFTSGTNSLEKTRGEKSERPDENKTRRKDR